jgi:hypothetical protein
MDEFFTGRIFLATISSVWKISIRDLCSSPEIMKVHIRHTGQDLEVPVGGCLIGKFYVAITSKGAYRYSMANHQRKLLSEPPKRIEEVKKSLWGQKTWDIVGLFLRQDEADACLDQQFKEVFDRRWHYPTKEVLLAIGMNHPLITISTDRELAVPVYLYDRSLPIPDEVEQSK